jgi:hypothetical protein
MANTYKDIIIYPSRSSDTLNPNIQFRGANSGSNVMITMSILPDSNGTLSFDVANVGQVMALTGDMSGSIYSINDISGTPLIEVHANGVVEMVPFGGNVHIGQQGPFSNTTPGGNTYGIHFNGQVTADYATGITWNGGSGGFAAQAGLYVQGSGSYGSKMYFATTDSYAAGAKVRLEINHAGNIWVKENLYMTSGKAIYMDFGGAVAIVTNDTSTYGALRSYGSKGSYGGWYDSYSGVNMMWSSDGSGGQYREANSTWHYYWQVGNACLGVGNSTTSASYKLYVSGAIYATGDIVAYSDARKKENIYTIDSALAKVCVLRGVYFNRIDDETKRKQTGVIAQEVNEVMPEVVTHSETTDAEGKWDEEYGVNYGALVGVLIEAVKELNAKVDAQAKLIEELRNG